MKLFILVLPLFILVSCNTWEGVKEDTKQAGRAIGEATESAGGALKEVSQ